MKLHVYMQENSGITWVKEDLWTEAEAQELRVKKVGEFDSADYSHVGMGYYRHIKCQEVEG